MPIDRASPREMVAWAPSLGTTRFGCVGSCGAVEEIVMANNIVELVSQELSPNVIGHLATVIGEPPASTARAASIAAPVILAGIAQRASTEGGAAQLLNDIRAGGYDREDARSPIDALEDPSSRPQVAESGRSILLSTFGHRLENLLGTVAGPTGLKKGALGILMSLLAPIAMRTVGTQVRERNLDAKGLHTYLSGQRAAIASVLPTPLAKMIESEQAAPASLRSVAEAPFGVGRREAAVVGEGRPRPLWPFLAALLVALALYTMARSGRRPPAVGPIPAPISEHAAKAPEGPTIQPPTLPPSVQVPSEPAIGGGPRNELANPSAGGVHALALYLATGGASGQKNDFALEGVTFTTGSAHLSTMGAAKVEDLAVLLKGHPSAKIKLVGHTDNAGDREANRVLSEDRANSVRDELVRMGIAQDRIETAGVGSDDPMAKNDSPANMEKNRRIDVIVVSP